MRSVTQITALSRGKVAPVYLVDLDTLRWTSGPGATISSVAYVHAPFTVDGLDISNQLQKPTITVDASKETYRQLMLSGSLQGEAIKIRSGVRGTLTDADFDTLFEGEIDTTKLIISEGSAPEGVITTLEPNELEFTTNMRVHPDFGFNHIMEVGVHEIAGVKWTVNERTR